MPRLAEQLAEQTREADLYRVLDRVIDSDTTFQLRRRLGIDTNPWKAFPRIITSMDYLRMPDVLQQFLQASGAGPDAQSNGGRTSPHAPWDLLIVDECHHFAPQTFVRPQQAFRHSG